MQKKPTVRTMLLCVAAVLAFLISAFAPALAQAASGFATANVNMRSGPGTRYPAVVVIPTGTPLEIHGCLANIPWCDVSFRRGRGWVAGQYVSAEYQNDRVYLAPRYYAPLGIPIVGFELGRYWDDNYRDRNFYRDRDYWRRGPGLVDRRDRRFDRDFNGFSDRRIERRNDPRTFRNDRDRDLRDRDGLDNRDFRRNDRDNVRPDRNDRRNDRRNFDNRRDFNDRNDRRDNDRLDRNDRNDRNDRRDFDNRRDRDDRRNFDGPRDQPRDRERLLPRSENGGRCRPGDPSCGN